MMSRHVQQTDEIDALLGEVANEFSERLANGESPSIDDYADKYPQIAQMIREVFPALNLLKVNSTNGKGILQPALASHFSSEPKSLGDFRILHELGRGGMGVVYEAEQLSMGRKVALKVLSFAALAQEKSLQRFRNEVRAAGALNHPNIVPIHAVGEERGVHFFAMQLIRGQNMSDVIAQLVDQKSEDDGKDASSRVPQETPPEAQARISTEGCTDNKSEFVRTAAWLGVQAGEALQHAHDQGVLHRDIKPGNLMLDAEGQLYITDFGLARIETDVGVTMTGDLVGTLRYMSPEQALAKRIVIDHRSDIYSLGVTLYELLTLRPAFDGANRQELLKQIAFEEPPRPCQINRSIPRDLETIVLKSMEKDLDERYATAGELADDLRAFLEHRPIKAKPPTLIQRSAKWSRRHRPLVASGIVFLLLATIGLAISTVIVLSQKAQTARALEHAKGNFNTSETHRQQAEQAVDFTEKLLYVRNLSLAAKARQDGDMRRAAALLRSSPAFENRPDLRGFEWHYLRHLVLPEHIILTQNQGEIISARYSPDGRLIAIGAVDGSIELWDAQSRHRLRVLQGHSGEITQLDFHPNGRQLASASEDGTVRIWPLSSSEEVIVIPANPGGMTLAICFSPDGETLATGGDDDVVRLWSESAFEPNADMVGHTNDIRCLTFMVDGQTLASGSNDGDIKLWDVGSGREVDTLRGHSDWVLSLTTEPQGNLLISGASEATIRVWDLEQARCISTIRGHLDMVQALAFVGHSNRLISGDRGGTVRIWDISDVPKSLDAPGVYLQAHTDGVWSIDASNDGRQFVTAGRDGSVRIWLPSRTVSSFRVANNDRQIQDFEFAGHGSTLAILDDLGVVFWDFSSDDPPDFLSHQGKSDPQSVAVSSNEKTTAIGYRDGAVVLYSDTAGSTLEIAAHAEEDSVDRLAFSPDGTSLATASDHGDQVRVWNTSTGEMSADLEATGDNLTFSPDGKLLACVDGRDCVIISTDTWQEVFRVTGNFLHITDVAFNAQGTLFAASSANRKIVLWDTVGWTPRSEIDAHRDRVESIAFSLDGRTLASGARDGTIKLWHVELGQEFFELERQPSPVTKLVFSPDGHQLLAQLDNGVMTVFDIRASRNDDKGAWYENLVGSDFRASHESTIGGIVFPQGEISFADAVVTYDPLHSSGPGPTVSNFMEPNASLGLPDFSGRSTQGSGAVALGHGGRLTLRFTDNLLTGSDDASDDLYIFEVGPEVEETFIEISADGIHWNEVGAISGSTAGIDIDAFGFTATDTFSYVRLTDSTTNGKASGVTVGADIDAVGAISTLATSELGVEGAEDSLDANETSSKAGPVD